MSANKIKIAVLTASIISLAGIVNSKADALEVKYHTVYSPSSKQVNLYTDSTSSAIKQTIPRGSMVEYLGEYNGRYRVKYVDYMDNSHVVTGYLAEDNLVYKSTAKPKATMRSSNSTSSKIILEVPNQKEVTVLNNGKTSNNFYKICYNVKVSGTDSEGTKITETYPQEGYTYKSNLSLNPFINQGITSAKVSLRTKANTTSTIVVRLKSNVKVRILSQTTNYYKVEYSAKYVGYVPKSKITSVTPKGTYVSGSDSIQVYKYASDKTKLVTVPSGTKVKITGASNKFYAIKFTYNNKSYSGYVPLSNMRLGNLTAMTDVAPYTMSTRVSLAEEKRNVQYTNKDCTLKASRSNYGKDLASLPSGTQVQLVEVIDGSSWNKVNYNGTNGYVKKENLEEPTGTISKSILLRKSASSADSAILTDSSGTKLKLSKGAKVTVLSQGRFYNKVKYNKSDVIPSQGTGTATAYINNSGDYLNFSTLGVIPTDDEERLAVIKNAFMELGCEYDFGCTVANYDSENPDAINESTDCSGLILFSYRKALIELGYGYKYGQVPRISAIQASVSLQKQGEPVDGVYHSVSTNKDTPIAQALDADGNKKPGVWSSVKLEPGDIVFLDKHQKDLRINKIINNLQDNVVDHVGMYIGNNKIISADYDNLYSVCVLDLNDLQWSDEYSIGKWEDFRTTSSAQSRVRSRITLDESTLKGEDY